MWSRIITKLLDHHRSASGPEGISADRQPFVGVRERLLCCRKAHQAAHAQGHGQNHAANHEFEAPTLWRYSCHSRLLPWTHGLLHALWIFWPCRSPTRVAAAGLLSPKLYAIL